MLVPQSLDRSNKTGSLNKIINNFSSLQSPVFSRPPSAMDILNGIKVTVIKKYPTYRDHLVNGCWKWIEGKQKDDNAGEYWRIHDRLYDLTDFVTKHPGGQYWLEVTKGTDITEAFESHHVSAKPAGLLNKFYVCDAVDPRNYFYTYDDDGFYQNLKKKISKKLNSVDKEEFTWKSKLIHDVNLVFLFIAAILANRADDNLVAGFWYAVGAQCLAWLVSCSHNFAHQKDNWRMKTMNMSLVTWREFRVFHVLSHHMYPNSYADFEVSLFEPYFKWIPTQRKSWFYIIFSILISPVLYLTFFHNLWRMRVQGYFCAKEKVFYWDELLLLALPAAMITFGKEPVTLSYLGVIYARWGYILIPAEFLFSLVFFNRGQHGTDQLHQNDEIKSLDFGEYQLATTVDRKGAKLNIFTSLTYFGDGVLHHLFPTIDHSLLPCLRDELKKTCKEFDIKLPGETSVMGATFGQIKQLYRSEAKRG